MDKITTSILFLLILIGLEVYAQKEESINGVEQVTRLENKISFYNEIIRDKWIPLSEDLILRVGDSSIFITVVKKNLFLVSDFSNTDTTVLFTKLLVNEIKNTQRLFGLEVSGVIDRKTIQLLNNLPLLIVKKMEINIDRWNVFFSDSILKTDLYLLANIPDFSLSVISCDTTKLFMKAIYGKISHKTPLISGKITHIVINPSWVVPSAIAENELLPLIKRDRQYFKDNHMILYEKNDKDKISLDPDSIDWTTVLEDSFNFTIEQIPGKWNALGNLKFYFPNKLNIYLHDTPEKYLFSRNKRVLSHGCIRVEKPVELATYLFFDNYQESNQREILGMIQTDEPNQYIKVPVATPLFICYFSAWVDDRNILQLREDIYGYDALVKGE